MLTIYDYLTSKRLALYWEDLAAEQQPYKLEEYFPNEQKLGMTIEWLRGANGVPKVLKLSALDVEAIPRQRIGFDHYMAQMPFFKESKFVDETMRQQLNLVLESGNEQTIMLIMDRIFNDEMELLQAAAAQRERMRAMLLTSGVISVVSNGQRYDYDYQMPEDHKITVKKSWSDPEANIIQDIRDGIDKIVEDTGVTVTKAITSSKVLGYIRKNKLIKDTLIVLTQGSGYVSDNRIISYMQDELGIAVETYDSRYVDEKGITQRFIDDDLFIMFPDSRLGTTWFGTTPEQSDLMSSGVANVSVVDTGVAITTMQKVDPVTVETKVTMVCMPDFPTADQVLVMDVIAA